MMGHLERWEEWGMCWAGFYHVARMGGGRQEFAGAAPLGVLTHREFHGEIPTLFKCG